MKVLIVTQYLDNFAGTELFTLNISKKFNEMNHEVSVYSPVLGRVAEKIREIGVPVTDNILDYKNEKFDVIHAQHNITAILARSVFPTTPMTFMSHGILPDLEQPPSINIGIEKYIVVSEEIKKHLIEKYSIFDGNIEIVRNSVDVKSFRAKKACRTKAKKLLVISNRYIDRTKTVVEGVCKDLGLDVTHIGLPENPVPAENVVDCINSSDIVVTLGRGALEAMACERNVIIYDIHGGDGFVDEKNFLELRKNNFSGRRFKKEYDKSSFKNEILKYDPTLGKKLRDIVQKEHSIYKLTNDLLNIYSEVKAKPVKKSIEGKQLYRELNFLESFNSQLEKQTKEQRRCIEDKVLEIHEKDREIKSRNSVIWEKNNDISGLKTEIIAIKNSKFWKLRNIYVRFGPRRVARIPRRVIRVLRRDGIKMFIKKIGYLVYFRGHIPQQYPEYQQWIRANERYNLLQIKAGLDSLKYHPKISVIVPVWNVEPKWLDMAIESVRNQYYENWELCLYDDASTKGETIDCLKRWQTAGDERIKVGFGKKNQHISGSSNEALKMATGEFITLLDNDDELAPFALYENVKLLNEHKDADFIYSDEDKMDNNGKRSDPFFKPIWSPELMLSQMYTCHLGVYRKNIIDKIGGFRKGYEGAQDYDLVLRFVEKTDASKIFHIPKVLYHWRTIETSTASGASAKDYAHGAAQKALNDYLKRNKLGGEVLDGPASGTHRVKLEIKGNPLVSVIIPFRDHVEVLKTCVDSIIEKTDYDNYEIILVDNQSEKKETKEYLKELGTNPRVKTLKYSKPFCYSAINNHAVSKAEGEYVLLLNNDTEVITEEWLRSMLEQAQKEGVGAVGAKLLYPTDRIQHAGVIMGMGIAGHSFKGFLDEAPNYFKHADITKNYSAVTAACLMVKKSIYEEVGGLNEKDLKVAYNDVDFCLRVLEAGYRNVYTPYAKLYHYESLSRGYDHELKKTNPKEYKRVVAEWDYMYKKWDNYIKNDPYYSPNLTRKHENFSIRTK